ncbi:IclR family transcriptional regulator [Mesorhizobium sp. M7A.F.Ca.US.006.01.1.1]|uniref:IclR family transcriptional regulator n=1 Tax=Mesorhizobium sp. M7A.F.Ca.US.006.01.1.1 TaxID=2496707 RepID=UPI0013E31471|nr:IclR family transcriptional regulator [Mesorhizobium sp. M7A.F.Ca.US.006.01.1.1]
MGAKHGSGYIVGPVIKALQVLDYIGASGREVSLTEVAKAVSLPKTTVFRYLQTLSSTSYLRHDIANDRYGIGTAFRSLARTDRSLQRLREVATPIMRKLNREFNETINLAIESQGWVIYIEIIESTRHLRMQAHIGARDPMHTTALGKAILAYLGEAEREKVLCTSLSERTYRTVLDVCVLRKQLNEVRRRGFAVEIGENEDVSMCVGVPILDDLTFPFAALSLSAPVQRHSETLVTSTATALLTASREIGEMLRSESLFE